MAVREENVAWRVTGVKGCATGCGIFFTTTINEACGRRFVAGGSRVASGRASIVLGVRSLRLLLDMLAAARVARDRGMQRRTWSAMFAGRVRRRRELSAARRGAPR